MGAPIGVDRSVLLEYQRRFITDDAPLVIGEKSRRIGFSWALAARFALTAASPSQRGGMDCWYVVGSEADAREFIEDAARWTRALALMCDDITREMYEDEGEAILAFVIRFKSGHKITALSSNPRRLRGKQGMAALDEAAHCNDIDQFLKAALAFLAWGGKVFVLSTHHGEDNPFNRLVEEAKAGKRGRASVHRVTLDDALADGLGKRIAARLATAGQLGGYTPAWEEQWRQELIESYGDFADEELFCVPSTAGAVYLTRAQIEACMVDRPILRLDCSAEFGARPEPERRAWVDKWITANLRPLIRLVDQSASHFLGEDFGRVSDLTVLAPLQIVGERREVPFLVELRNVPLSQQQQIADATIGMLRRFQRAKFDATGNGFALAEHCRDRWGQRVEAVTLGKNWGLEVWPPLKGAFQDGAISIPRDPFVVDDLLAVRMHEGTPKLARVAANARQRRHGDAAVAIGLAYAASMGGAVRYSYTPAERDDGFGGLL